MTAPVDIDTLYYFNSQTGEWSDRPPAPARAPLPKRYEPGCTECERGSLVPHHNCLYDGGAAGHSRAHCTAAACY